jgi:hypothetical protein
MGVIPCRYWKDSLTTLGYNMYMTPEQAAKGLQILELTKNKVLLDSKMEEQRYPDLTQYAIYNVSSSDNA